MIKAKTLGDKTLLFGLNWSQTSKESLVSDIKSESDRIAMDFGISRSYTTSDGSMLYQYSLSDYEDSVGAYSGADVLSSLQENVIFIYSVTANISWVCIIHDGEVVSGGDILLEKGNFHDDFQNTLKDLEVDTSQFRIYADSNAIEFAEGLYEAEVDFNEIVGQLEFSDFQKFYKIRKNLQKYILAGLGVAVIAGAFYLASSLKGEEIVMQQQPKPSIDNMRMKIPEERKRNVGDIVNQKVGPSKTQIMEDAYKEELSWLNFDYNLNNNSKLLSNIAKFLRAQDINLGGWSAKNYYYDISVPKYHEVVWAKKSYGTALTLKDSLKKKGISQLQFNDNGSLVSSFVNLKDSKPDVEKNILRVMKESQRDLFHFMHDLDVKNFHWMSELTPVSERPVPIAGISNMIQAKKRQLEVKTRDFRISGSGINEIEKLANLLESHDRFLVQRLSFDFNQNFNWIIYGVFYEQEIR